MVPLFCCWSEETRAYKAARTGWSVTSRFMTTILRRRPEIFPGGRDARRPHRARAGACAEHGGSAGRPTQRPRLRVGVPVGIAESGGRWWAGADAEPDGVAWPKPPCQASPGEVAP